MGDEVLFAGDSGVVAGLDRIRVAGADVQLGAGDMREVPPPADDCADVASLAGLGADYRLDALGPVPAGLDGAAN